MTWMLLQERVVLPLSNALWVYCWICLLSCWLDAWQIGCGLKPSSAWKATHLYSCAQGVLYLFASVSSIRLLSLDQLLIICHCSLVNHCTCDARRQWILPDKRSMLKLQACICLHNSHTHHAPCTSHVTIIFSLFEIPGCCFLFWQSGPDACHNGHSRSPHYSQCEKKLAGSLQSTDHVFFRSYSSAVARNNNTTTYTQIWEMYLWDKERIHLAKHETHIKLLMNWATWTVQIWLSLLHGMVPKLCEHCLLKPDSSFAAGCHMADVFHVL